MASLSARHGPTLQSLLSPHPRPQPIDCASLAWRPLQNDAIILTNFLALPFVVVVIVVVAWLLARLLSAFVGF